VCTAGASSTLSEPCNLIIDVSSMSLSVSLSMSLSMARIKSLQPFRLKVLVEVLLSRY
jgi:hypothetical protein